jgi:multidrug transporter EmrE-like cation transporter
MYYRSPSYDDKLGIILRALIGAGIVIVTVSMILLFADALSSANSLFLQLMVAGGILLGMSFLTLRIFERL